jgi:hypothetical protein
MEAPNAASLDIVQIFFFEAGVCTIQVLGTIFFDQIVVGSNRVSRPSKKDDMHTL